MIDQLIVDGHVHVHQCFDEASFLEAAYANLARYGSGFPTLLLAEMAGANVFARWREGGAPWPVTLTREASSLVLGGKLLVVAGRQIVTSERIEVLAQLTAEAFVDGEPLEATIERVLASEAIAVLPWGVGKWFGARGRKVAAASGRYPVFLGDNAGRFVGWPAPSLYRSRIVLPGSDPLGLRSQARAVGMFGFHLPGPFDPEQPVVQMRRALKGLAASPRGFGRRVGIFAFMCQQLGLRIAR